MTVAEWETVYNQLKALKAVIPSTDTTAANLLTFINNALGAARSGLVTALNAET